MKRNIKYWVIERRTVNCSSGLTSDQTIMLNGAKAKDCPIVLRRVGYFDAETGNHYVFLNNIFHFAAQTIADIYRERWQIELFFNWIEQNLRIKTFFRTSRNAVMSQIWMTIITFLLLADYKFLAKLDCSLSQILKLLQLNLFSRRDLYELFDPQPDTLSTQYLKQLTLNFNAL